MAQTMTRRAFGVGAASAAMSLALAEKAEAAQFNYKYGANLPLDSPLCVRMVEMWNDVAKESGGRLVVQVFPNNILGGDTAMLTQLRSGALQFFTLAGGILASVVPAAALDSIGFSFKSSAEGQKAFDGPLGAYIRKDIESKGLVVFPNVWEIGMRQITSSTHPIRNADDLANFKLRTPASNIWVDLFKTLGASPTPLNYSEVYTSLQTHIIDGTELPLVTIEVGKLFEVQKYLSMTDHMWSAFWFLANQDAWKALPADIQGIVQRNAAKYAILQRRDMALLAVSLSDKLQRQGMVMNKTDVASFRAKLGPYYARWKEQLGPTAWTLLEDAVGKLG
jgi:TRAP-type transport system periplasmic protein